MTRPFERCILTLLTTVIPQIPVKTHEAPLHGGGGRGGSRIWQWGGARFVANRVTYTSEASINQLGVRGALKAPREIFEFRTPESESERNMTNYFKLLSGKNFFCVE